MRKSYRTISHMSKCGVGTKLGIEDFGPRCKVDCGSSSCEIGNKALLVRICKVQRNREFSASDCREVGEYHGNPFTSPNCLADVDIYSSHFGQWEGMNTRIAICRYFKMIHSNNCDRVDIGKLEERVDHIISHSLDKRNSLIIGQILQSRFTYYESFQWEEYIPIVDVILSCGHSIIVVMGTPMRITILVGGIGGARFLKGLRLIPNLDISVIVNNGDDITMHGLRICPDLDSVIYNLAGVSDLARGWGRADETWRIQEELASYLGEQPWFNLGDKDFATHIYRTQLLKQGIKLNEIVAAQCVRWNIEQKILPATNEYVETKVHLEEAFNGALWLHFQEWWVRYHAAPSATKFELAGGDEAKPAPGVLDAIESADLILLAPSNPIVSIGTILQIPGIREALIDSSVPIIGFSPIIGDHPVLGMADRCLSALKLETSATSVAALYGSRRDGGLLNGWLIADSDFEQVERIEKLGILCQAIPLLMKDELATKTMANAAIALAESVSIQ